MLTTLPRSKDQYLAIEISHKATAQDYRDFEAVLDGKVREHKLVRLLMVLHDFHGWTIQGAWENVRVGIAHRKEIEKVAIVGEHKLDEAIAWAFEIFTSSHVEFFQSDHVEDAWKWLRADTSAEFRSRGDSVGDPVTGGKVQKSKHPGS